MKNWRTSPVAITWTAQMTIGNWSFNYTSMLNNKKVGPVTLSHSLYAIYVWNNWQTTMEVTWRALVLKYTVRFGELREEQTYVNFRWLSVATRLFTWFLYTWWVSCTIRTIHWWSCMSLMLMMGFCCFGFDWSYDLFSVGLNLFVVGRWFGGCLFAECVKVQFFFVVFCCFGSLLFFLFKMVFGN